MVRDLQISAAEPIQQNRPFCENPRIRESSQFFVQLCGDFFTGLRLAFDLLLQVSGRDTRPGDSAARKLVE
jgi:hypothetical protein